MVRWNNFSLWLDEEIERLNLEWFLFFRAQDKMVVLLSDVIPKAYWVAMRDTATKQMNFEWDRIYFLYLCDS